MTSSLAQRECVPCQGGVPPLESNAIAELLPELLDDWSTPNDHHLARTFRFPDFAEALAFVNEVGAIAERENHHPDLRLAWGRVVVEVWTHKIDGLTESDFVFAAKCDAAYAARSD